MGREVPPHVARELATARGVCVAESLAVDLVAHPPVVDARELLLVVNVDDLHGPRRRVCDIELRGVRGEGRGPRQVEQAMLRTGLGLE